MSKYLNSDESENKRIYVPDTYFVKDGKIVGHNNSMSMLSEIDPNEYFDEEKRKVLKEEFIELIEKVYDPVCDDVTQSIYGC